MSTKANPNKIVISEYLDAPGQTLTWSGKQVEVAHGARCAGLVVVDGTLKLSGELDVAHVSVANPTGGDGAPDNGLYLSGATGLVGTIQTLGVQRDHGKIGSGTHDLEVLSWIAGCAPPLIPEPGEDPVHRDGLQVMSCERVTIERFWLVNQYPGATNGGIWVNPQKKGNQDANDASIIQDFVIEQARIVFPNAAVHLGACTRCGARSSLLAAQRPFRLDDRTLDPVDVENEKVVLDA
jgi:hypothetical protein